MKNKALTLILSSAIFLNGCVVGYYKYPKNQLETRAPEKLFEKATYFVKGMSLAGGNVAVAETLRLQSPFKQMDELQEIPPSGIHIHVDVETISPSVPAIAFGYISFATLTILPAWSTKDGVQVRFNIYKDKALLKTITYDLRRAGGVWLGLLPFIWANLMTTSEEKACEAVVKQFFEDAKPLFSSAVGK